MPKSHFTSEELQALWPACSDGIEDARHRFACGEWSAAETTSAVMTSVWQAARGDRWHNGRRRRRPNERQISTESPLAAIQNFRWRGIQPAAQHVLLDWHFRLLPLQLYFDIPSPEEVLNQQSEGRRCVSALIGSREEFSVGGAERDGFSFILHDLIHASHFYADHDHFRRQVFFSRWMSEFSRRTRIQLLCREDAEFAGALEYLTADMNTHWVHAIKCLKSIVPAELQNDCLLSLNRVGGPDAGEAIAKIWTRLNTPAENEDLRVSLDRQLSEFLDLALADLTIPATFVEHLPIWKISSNDLTRNRI